MPDSGIFVLFEGRNLVRLLEGLFVTLNISLLSAALSIPLGILLGIVMTSRSRLVRAAARAYLEFVRIMPQLVLLFVVYFGFTRSFGWNLSAWASAVIVFTFWGTAEMGDLVRGALLAIPRSQYESARVLGFSKFSLYRFIIIPQTLRQLTPPAINLITRMIKTTSLVLMIGVVGPSGCGKSTLLRCLNGLEPVQAGRVKLGSETVAYGGKNLAALRQRILLLCRFRLCCIRQCRSCWQ